MNTTDNMLKNFFIGLLFEYVHTALPGKIISYNQDTKTAKVKPLIKRKYFDSNEAVELKEIYNVPVVNFSFNNCGIIIPEADYADQECLLVFCERNISNWKATGNDSVPDNQNKFDLSDAIAVVTLNNKSKGITKKNNFTIYWHDKYIELADNITIFGDNKIVIKNNGDIELGSSGLLPLITDSIISKYNSHTHTSGAEGAPTSSPITGSISSSDATQKVKAQ